jgi:DNA-binding GntR family transcriptional regulator
MHEAYEIRAALEEIGGRAAARVLKGNTGTLWSELAAMRAAFSRRDLDRFVEHDVTFHRRILLASQNQVLLRVWDSLAVDSRRRRDHRFECGTSSLFCLRSASPTDSSAYP